MRKVLVSSSGKHSPHRASLREQRRVLVTGGAGYLGSTLVRRLLQAGYGVRVLDALYFGGEPLASVYDHPDFEFLWGDVRDPAALQSAAVGCDTVVHLAAIVGDRACDLLPDLAGEVNTASTAALLEFCRKHCVRRFLLASTCSVYGVSPRQVDENSRGNPVSLYAKTKLAAEELVLGAASADFHPTVLRLATLFGMSPRPRFDLVVNLLSAQAACCRRISILNGRQWRPFVHVDDAARAFELCMAADASAVSRQVLNVGDGRLNLQISDLSQKIRTVVPSLQAVYSDLDDPRSYYPSFEKIRNSLGFRSRQRIEDGIAEVFDAVSSGAVRDFREPRYSNELALAAL